MEAVTIRRISEDNKAIAGELLRAYGKVLYEELKLMAGYDSFYKELETFPDLRYFPPEGGFYIAYVDDIPIGCAGFKRFNQYSCELKRMYIEPNYRGRGFGRELTLLMLAEIKASGYQKVLLDTNLEMPAAINTYLGTGFAQINPYCVNTNANPRFFELNF